MKVKCVHQPHGSDHDFSKSFMYSVHQMYFLVQKHLEHALSLQKSLSFSQFMILVGFSCSQSSEGVSQSDIAEKLYLAEATVSRHISTLVKLGYLSRSLDKQNRRKHSIAITPLGHKIFAQTGAVIDKELHSIFKIIKEEDRAGIMNNFTNVLSLLLAKK